MKVIKEINKQYRQDLAMWECSMKLFFFSFYLYKVWIDGETVVRFRLNRKPNADYFVFRRQPDIEISQKEFKEVYHSNRWTVPLNFKISDK